MRTHCTYMLFICLIFAFSMSWYKHEYAKIGRLKTNLKILNLKYVVHTSMPVDSGVPFVDLEEYTIKYLYMHLRHILDIKYSLFTHIWPYLTIGLCLLLNVQITHCPFNLTPAKYIGKKNKYVFVFIFCSYL